MIFDRNHYALEEVSAFGHIENAGDLKKSFDPTEVDFVSKKVLRKSIPKTAPTRPFFFPQNCL
jgi:hypothetical protein